MANTNPIVTITMENGDVMKAELYPEIAPNTVNNFISLVKKGFYDGLIFHRVINGFMIQGGCPDGTGMGGPGYSIKGEFAQNGVANDLAHTPGVLSMARAMHPNSGGSQFFIMHKAAPHLDGSYAAFGKVIEGMDVVNKIAETETDFRDRPLDDQQIKSMTVDTFGQDDPHPLKSLLNCGEYPKYYNIFFTPKQKTRRRNHDSFHDFCGASYVLINDQTSELLRQSPNSSIPHPAQAVRVHSFLL